MKINNKMEQNERKKNQTQNDTAKDLTARNNKRDIIIYNLIISNKQDNSQI